MKRSSIMILALTITMSFYIGDAMAGLSGHRKLIGTVKNIQGNLISITTEEGTTRTFTLSEVKREGLESLQAGDKLILEMDEGNQIVDLHQPHRHTSISGTVETFRASEKTMTLRLPDGKTRRFELKDPAVPKIASVKEGTHIILEIDEQDRVMDVHNQ